MGKSSKDKRDAYYRLAKEQGWRARSAFKLIQLDEQFDLFDGVTRVVDLCAAPGSWSQVLSRILIKGESFGRRAYEERKAREDKVINGDYKGADDIDESKVLKPREGVKIVAVDLQPMASLEGITTLKGDITNPDTVSRIFYALDPSLPASSLSHISASPTLSSICTPNTTTTSPPLVDLVLSDGAPDVTGLHDFDIYIQSSLLFSALNLAIRILRPTTGKFVAKIFRAKDCELIYAQLSCFFRKVSVAKPRSSRASSLEAFVVCEGFEMPKGYTIDPEVPVGLGTYTPSSSTKKPKTREEKEREGWVDGQRRVVQGDGTTILEFEEDEEFYDNRWIAPFIACGDLSAFDADATYHLPGDRVSLDPVQPPTAPPYKLALEMRRRQGGFYGKTKGKKEDKEFVMEGKEEARSSVEIGELIVPPAAL